MGGSITGGLNTKRLSATGPRTYLSMLACTDTGAGAGGIRRIYNYAQRYPSFTPDKFYNTEFRLKYGQLKDRYIMYTQY